MVEEIQKLDDNDGIDTFYNIKFNNLTDLYNYLISSPSTNKIFTEPSSLKNNKSFAGESLEKSIDYCIGGYKKNFDNFLQASNQLSKINNNDEDTRCLSRSLYGGIPLPPLVAAGVPDCMLKYGRNKDVKYINIYFSLSYPCHTTSNQIVNRGLATLNLVKTFENKGYIVNFKAFELSHCDNEAVNIMIDLKKPGDLFLNIEKCYFPLVAKEFLRRILFRVLECSAVKNKEWTIGYGESADIKTIKKIFKTNKNDLIISYPKEMNIQGKNIYQDTLNLIEKLEIQDEFNVEKIKKLVKM